MDRSWMSGREELLRMFVLDVIADDYENLEKIHEEVADLSAKCGLSVQRTEITRALISLIESDFASAYKLWPATNKIEGVPPTEELGKCYYYLTRKGRELQDSEYAGWPFADTGELREDWTPPRD